MSNELVGSLVAVYGSLREGLHNHPVLGDSQWVDTVVIEGFDMHSYGAYPYITDGARSVVAELYRVVAPQDASALDSLEGYPHFYDRRQVDTTHGKAWIYFINNEDNSHHDLVEDGDWVEYYSQRTGVL